MFSVFFFFKALKFQTMFSNRKTRSTKGVSHPREFLVSSVSHSWLVTDLTAILEQSEYFVQHCLKDESGR